MRFVPNRKKKKLLGKQQDIRSFLVPGATVTQTTVKEQIELSKRSLWPSERLCSDSEAPLVPLTAAFDQRDPLRPRVLRGPLPPYWWAVSLFHTLTSAAEGRLLALTIVALHPTPSWRWRGPSEVLLSCVGRIKPTCRKESLGSSRRYRTDNTRKKIDIHPYSQLRKVVF